MDLLTLSFTNKQDKPTAALKDGTIDQRNIFNVLDYDYVLLRSVLFICLLHLSVMLQIQQHILLFSYNCYLSYRQRILIGDLIVCLHFFFSFMSPVCGLENRKAAYSLWFLCLYQLYIWTSLSAEQADWLAAGQLQPGY